VHSAFGRRTVVAVETERPPKRLEDLDPSAPGANDEGWRIILTGADPELPRLRQRMKRLPSSPRCKMCAAPFAGPGRLLTRLMMHGPSTVNPLLCSICFHEIGKHPGGAEIPIGVLFADIRGSTGLAERTSAKEFRHLVERFYRRASKAIDDHDGIVDKFLGDGIMALFIPVISGEQLADRAIAAGEAVLQAVDHPELVAGGVRVGVGVHAGDAFVGAIGSADRLDFTALGDTVNVAARLGSLAGAGELFVSAAAWAAAGREASTARRSVALSGRNEPLEVVVLGSASEAVVA